MVFNQREYYQEIFSRLTLAKEVVESITFEECNFKACSFIDCRLQKCKFTNCNFEDCILSAVTPMNSRFSQVKFSRCKVIGLDWTRTQATEELDFSACQINYSNFKLMKLPKIRIVNCEAREVDFSEADLRDGNLKNSDFEKSRFFKTNLTNADLRGAKNYNIDVKTNILKKTRFSLPEALGLLQPGYYYRITSVGLGD